MVDIRYGEDFYVNIPTLEGRRLAENNIELFTKTMAEEHKECHDKLKNNDLSELKWQSVIFGDSKYNIFSKSSVGLFLMNSKYIAYSVDKDPFDHHGNIKSGILFNFITFDKNITTYYDELEQEIIISTPYEDFLISVGSETIAEDYQIIDQYIRLNSRYKDNKNIKRV